MKPFIPDTLPLENIDYKRLITLVGKANQELAEYNGLMQAMSNPTLLLSPLTREEAVLSSKIEGTQATAVEVLEHEAGEVYDERKETDIKEIQNYRKALTKAEEQAKEFGITLGLLLELHKILMDSVRGENKSPGNFRKDQNWIGPYKCPIEKATFVPPSPLILEEHLRYWENYMKIEDFDLLAQTAIIHAQFEILHPFKDGNGRIGRLIIPLFLYSRGALIRPMFYLSNYLEENRTEYYARLKAISDKRDWNGWIEFFLKGIIEQARMNIIKTRAILELYDETLKKIIDVTRSQYASQLIDAFYDRPIFKVNELAERLGIPKPTIVGLIGKLHEEKILTLLREGSGRRPALYAFYEIINIAEGTEVLSHR